MFVKQIVIPCHHLLKLLLAFGLAIFASGFMIGCVPQVVAAATESSLQVTATVPLSDYFADLLAHQSLVTATVSPDKQLSVHVQIRSTNNLVFSGHPLAIRLSETTTGQTVRFGTGQTAAEGKLQTVMDVTDLLGNYQVFVVDLAYERPIELATTPGIPLELPPVPDRSTLGAADSTNPIFGSISLTLPSVDSSLQSEISYPPTEANLTQLLDQSRAPPRGP